MKTTTETAIELINEWHFINKRGWDWWDDAIAQRGVDPDRALLTQTGSVLSHLRFLSYVPSLAREKRENPQIAWFLVEESEKAKATLRAERGRLLPPRLTKSTKHRKRKAGANKEAQRARKRKDQIAKYRMAKEAEAARYMLVIVSSMRFIDAYELIRRLPPFPWDVQQRINALGWQPKLLTYKQNEQSPP